LPFSGGCKLFAVFLLVVQQINVSGNTFWQLYFPREKAQEETSFDSTGETGEDSSVES